MRRLLIEQEPSGVSNLSEAGPHSVHGLAKYQCQPPSNADIVTGIPVPLGDASLKALQWDGLSSQDPKLSTL